MSNAICKTCRWFDNATPTSQSGTHGHCRIGPPRYSDHPQSNGAQGYWPEVHYDDWCGDHPDRQPRLEGLSTTLVGRETFPTAADMRRIVDALEKMARTAPRGAS